MREFALGLLSWAANKADLKSLELIEGMLGRLGLRLVTNDEFRTTFNGELLSLLELSFPGNNGGSFPWIMSNRVDFTFSASIGQLDGLIDKMTEFAERILSAGHDDLAFVPATVAAYARAASMLNARDRQVRAKAAALCAQIESLIWAATPVDSVPDALPKEPATPVSDRASKEPERKSLAKPRDLNAELAALDARVQAAKKRLG